MAPLSLHSFAPVEALCLILLVLGLLGALVILLARSRGGDYPYVAAPALLTPAERSFFRVLQEAIGRDYHLFAKVRLADLIEVERGLTDKRRYAAFGRISSKHADFVACDPKTFQVLGVIELDDSSHRATKRRERDAFVDAALAAAFIPIMRVPAQRTYAVAPLREQARATFHANK